MMLKDCSAVCRADVVADALAWLTVLTRLANPAAATLTAFKQLCIKEAADHMAMSVDWNSSRQTVSAFKAVQA